MKTKALALVMLITAIMLLTSCGAVLENGNLKIKDNGQDIVSIGKDGFMLKGNVTGLSLDEHGLHLQYPNGSIAWDDAGFTILHADGSIRIADGKMVIADKSGKTKTLDTTGEGAQYQTDGGVIVKTGKKASIPSDFPTDKAPLMDGFVLNASAELGSVEMISGYVPKGTVEGAIEFYQPLLVKGSSYSHDKKGGGAVLKAKLDGTEVTVYIVKSLTEDAVNISIVAGK